MRQSYKKALTEVSEILKYTEKSVVTKVPRKFKKFVEKNKDKNYKIELEKRIAWTRFAAWDKAYISFNVPRLCVHKTRERKVFSKRRIGKWGKPNWATTEKSDKFSRSKTAKVVWKIKK